MLCDRATQSSSGWSSSRHALPSRPGFPGSGSREFDISDAIGVMHEYRPSPRRAFARQRFQRPWLYTSPAAVRRQAQDLPVHCRHGCSSAKRQPWPGCAANASASSQSCGGPSGHKEGWAGRSTRHHPKRKLPSGRGARSTVRHLAAFSPHSACLACFELPRMAAGFFRASASASAAKDGCTSLSGPPSIIVVQPSGHQHAGLPGISEEGHRHLRARYQHQFAPFQGLPIAPSAKYCIRVPGNETARAPAGPVRGRTYPSIHRRTPVRLQPPPPSPGLPLSAPLPLIRIIGLAAALTPLNCASTRSGTGACSAGLLPVSAWLSALQQKGRVSRRKIFFFPRNFFPAPLGLARAKGWRLQASAATRPARATMRRT